MRNQDRARGDESGAPVWRGVCIINTTAGLAIELGLRRTLESQNQVTDRRVIETTIPRRRQVTAARQCRLSMCDTRMPLKAGNSMLAGAAQLLTLSFCVCCRKANLCCRASRRAPCCIFSSRLSLSSTCGTRFGATTGQLHPSQSQGPLLHPAARLRRNQTAETRKQSSPNVVA